MKHSLALLSALLPAPLAILHAADSPKQPQTKVGVLRGLNGLVAAPVMSDAKGLPLRLMSVGVDDRGKVYVTDTVRQMREDISLLQSTFLHQPDMALTTVEAKEAWILKNDSPRIATAPELLESMLDPGAKIAPGYGLQMLELANGTTVPGTQMSETPEAIVLKSPDGELTTHPKAEIKSATKPIGVMPPMKQLLTLRELHDLVAFLSTLKGSN